MQLSAPFFHRICMSRCQVESEKYFFVIRRSGTKLLGVTSASGSGSQWRGGWSLAARLNESTETTIVAAVLKMVVRWTATQFLVTPHAASKRGIISYFRSSRSAGANRAVRRVGGSLQGLRCNRFHFGRNPPHVAIAD